MKKNLKKCLLILSVTVAAAISLAACGQGHKHTFKEGWSSDSQNHWHDSDCGHDVKDGLAQHKFTKNVTKQPTCQEQGTATYTCDDCGYSYTEPIPASEHTYDAAKWTAGTFTHWHVCSVCGEKSGETEHTFTQGVCSACNAEEDDMLTALYVFAAEGEGYAVSGLTETGAAREKLTLPAKYNGKNVTAIKQGALSECAAATVEIPASVTKIEDYAFQDCAALLAITLPAGLTELGNQVFSGCTALKSVNIPEAITELGVNLFLDCENLTTVAIASELSVIRAQAFADCSKLAVLEIPDTVTYIGMKAFKGTALTSVVVPESVTEIHSYAFENCTELVSAVINARNTNFTGAVFNGCTKLQTLTVPFVGQDEHPINGQTYAFGFLFGTYQYGTNETVYTAQQYEKTYYIPKSLTSVTVKGGIIEAGAFDGCAHLETITVAENVALKAVEFTDCTATIHVLGAPKVSDITLASTAYANEAVSLTYQATHGSAIEITVKRGADNAVSGTDYELNTDKTQITFKTTGTFTVTVKATLNDESAEKSAIIEIDVRGPELKNVALDKTSIKTAESVVLSYEIDTESEVAVTVKKGGADPASGDYTVNEKTYTFNVAGTYTITVTATRNGKTESETLTLTVADITVNDPVVTLTASSSSVEEGTAVTLGATVVYDTEHGDHKGTGNTAEIYEVFVQNGAEFVNADANLYTFNADHTSFTPLAAGTYQVKLTVNSEKGKTANGTVTITASLVEITLAWTTTPTANGWLRYTTEGGDIAYTVTGYAGGYDITYTTDNTVVSAGAATSGTAVHVSATEIDSATVKVTYTHKTDSSKTQSLTMPVSFVSDVTNAPILGEDPFGGTYGTLIPSTGLMLYFDAYDKDGTTKLTYDDVLYQVVSETTGLGIDKLDGTDDSIVVRKIDNRNDMPYLLAKNFKANGNANSIMEANTAKGTVTVKLSVTKNGATAAATKVFNVEPLKNKGGSIENLNSYFSAVFERGVADYDKSMSGGNRENAVVTKDGVIFNRDAGGWSPGDMVSVVVDGLTHFQIDFTMSIIKRIDPNNKSSFVIRFRTGNWDGFCGNTGNDGFSIYAENDSTTIAAGNWRGDNTWAASEDLPPAEIGTIIHARFVYSIETDTQKAVFNLQVSKDGGLNYALWHTFKVPVATDAGNLGTPIHAIQFGHEQGSFLLGGMTLTNLDA